MSEENKIEAEKLSPTTDFLPSDGASCSSSSILKRRMQLKRMEIKIEEAVSWNLGYCPSDVWHHELIDRRNDLSLTVSKTDPEWWAIYDRYRDTDNPKRLMVFLPTNA
jgi:hypothetical protein